MYKCSDSGSICEQIYLGWSKHHCFFERTKHINRPLLLATDNHSAHIKIDVMELALKDQVILLCLSHHNTQALHPLDLGTLEYVTYKIFIGR